MLAIRNLTKVYQTPQGFIPALKEVNISLEEGEFAFLVGKSGAGKTTLIRMLIREEVPTYGDIEFSGIQVTKIPRKLVPAYRRNVSVTFQDYKLLENKTVAENISFVLEMLNRNKQDVRQTTEELIDLVGMSHRSHLFPRQLSGGEKRRVVIARALASDPKLLIADEPTGDLDQENSTIIMDLLQKINKLGATVLMTTHNMDLLSHLNKRVITMECGEVIGDEKHSTRPMDKRVKRRNEHDFVKVLKKQSIDPAIVKKLQAGNIDNIQLLLHLPAHELLEGCRLSKKEYKHLIEGLSHIISKEEIL